MMTARKVWLAMDDDSKAHMLVEIARVHSKLALEHIGKTHIQSGGWQYEPKLNVYEW